MLNLRSTKLFNPRFWLVVCLLNWVLVHSSAGDCADPTELLDEQVEKARTFRAIQKSKDAYTLLKNALESVDIRAVNQALLLATYLDLVQLADETKNSEADRWKDLAIDLFQRRFSGVVRVDRVDKSVLAKLTCGEVFENSYQPTFRPSFEIASSSPGLQMRHDRLIAAAKSSKVSGDKTASKTIKGFEENEHLASVSTGVEEPIGAKVVNDAKRNDPASDEDIKRALYGSALSINHDGTFRPTERIPSTQNQLNYILNDFVMRYQNWKLKEPELKPKIVIFIHGGLVGEDKAIETIIRQRKFWLDNRIFPIFLVWHTGLEDEAREGDLSTEIIKFMTSQGAARYLNNDHIEWLARNKIKEKWEWMKRKALAPCEKSTPSKVNVGSQLIIQLANLQKKVLPGTEVHLIGHSAGSIVSAGLMEASDRAMNPNEQLSFSTVTFFAPAIRVGDFQKLVLRHLPRLQCFTIFNLQDQAELADRCVFGELIYKGSILYLVSRALEEPVFGEYDEIQNEVPILGMQVFDDKPMTKASWTPTEALLRTHGRINFAPQMVGPLDSRTNASRHGVFPTDKDTMNSTVRIILQAEPKTSWK